MSDFLARLAARHRAEPAILPRALSRFEAAPASATGEPVETYLTAIGERRDDRVAQATTISRGIEGPSSDPKQPIREPSAVAATRERTSPNTLPAEHAPPVERVSDQETVTSTSRAIPTAA